MDRQYAVDLNSIKRIVALLLGLALLAERAAARPAAMRMFVHSLLLGAEVAALALFIGPDEFDASAARAAPQRAEPCDLIRTAVSLRALAMPLIAACCLARVGGREPGFAPLVAGRPRGFRPCVGPVRPNDTS